MITCCLLSVILGILNGVMVTNAIWENRLRCRALDGGRLRAAEGTYYIELSTPSKKQG